MSPATARPKPIELLLLYVVLRGVCVSCEAKHADFSAVDIHVLGRSSLGIPAPAYRSSLETFHYTLKESTRYLGMRQKKIKSKRRSRPPQNDTKLKKKKTLLQPRVPEFRGDIPSGERGGEPAVPSPAHASPAAGPPFPSPSNPPLPPPPLPAPSSSSLLLELSPPPRSSPTSFWKNTDSLHRSLPPAPAPAPPPLPLPAFAADEVAVAAAVAVFLPFGDERERCGGVHSPVATHAVVAERLANVRKSCSLPGCGGIPPATNLGYRIKGGMVRKKGGGGRRRRSTGRIPVHGLT